MTHKDEDDVVSVSYLHSLSQRATSDLKMSINVIVKQGPTQYKSWVRVHTMHKPACCGR